MFRVSIRQFATASQGSAGQSAIANCIVIASPPLVYVIDELIYPAIMPVGHFSTDLHSSVTDTLVLAQVDQDIL
jgi:hypothetical protein